MTPTSTITLVAEGLLSKWGFNDGDMPDHVWDAIDDAGIPFASIEWHDVLRGLVRDYLIPALDQSVIAHNIETCHNPIRAESVNGERVPDAVIYGDLPSPRLTPEWVEVPMVEVLRRCRNQVRA